MRFPAEKIKAAILDPDLAIRTRVANYFARSSTPDASIMALVIEAVERYGRNGANHLIEPAADLPQTADSIAWVIDELNDEQSDRHENYTFTLSRVATHADTHLLLPHENAILEARYFLPDLRDAFTERLQMLAWDEATCWRRLEAECNAANDARDGSDHAKRIVEALARFGTKVEDKVHTLLCEATHDTSSDLLDWMVPMVARLAGKVHLESTIPVLVARLMQDEGDFLNQECAAALTTIGTPAVVQAISAAYLDAPSHFRIYAAGILENIHSDFTVDECWRLLRLTRDKQDQCLLLEALLVQFAYEGLDASRRFLVGREPDFDTFELRGLLLSTCTIMGETFPEFAEWKAAEQVAQDEFLKQREALKHDPLQFVQFAVERVLGKRADEELQSPLPKIRVPQINPPLPPELRRRIGRNDPCPCGSGKKFKKCCINQPSGEATVR